MSDEEKLETSPSTSSRPPPLLLLRPRREPFEHGLLPIPKLIFTDGTLTLAPLKHRLLQRCPNGVVADPQALADELQIPLDHARLALDILASVLPSDRDPAAGIDVNDLVLFLYIQSYKRLLPRSHKDPAAVADVWPSTSAFDGYLSALSPIQVAPFNTYYSQLVEHMAQVGVNPTVNRWNEPLVLGMVDPHDSLSHPAGVSDFQAESATCIDPDLFTNFLIPKWFGAESPESTKDNPFPLPEVYLASQRKKYSTFVEIQQALRDVQMDESRKRDLACVLHVHFKDWLYASGNIRQLYCLQGD